MKPRLFGLAAILLSLPALANDTASIDFDLTADAASCIPTLSNNGLVDYGTRHAANLSVETFTQLGTRDITLTIQCESSTGIAITARDTRADSVIVGKDDRGETGARFQINGGGYVSDLTRLFGLGLTSEGKPIGSYAVQINAAGISAVDAGTPVNVEMAGAASKNGPWVKSMLLPLPANQDYYYTFVQKGTTTPQAVMSANIPLQISTSVANKLGSRQEIKLDGSAVISIVYL